MHRDKEAHLNLHGEISISPGIGLAGIRSTGYRISLSTAAFFRSISITILSGLERLPRYLAPLV
jgi:hypothetical protein